jgi:hypothetical protein
LSLCLASAGVVKTLVLAAFTLAWTHSIEKVEWQEDWRLTPDGLVLEQARVKGSGAGMEPPPDARLIDGWFQWHPRRAPMPQLVLGNSGAAGEWRLCSAGKCRTLSEILGHPVGVNVTVMSACGDDREVGVPVRSLSPYRSPVTRQITSPTSSATSREPSGPIATPTGRPKDSRSSGARNPVRMSRGGPAGRPFASGTKTTL